MHPRKCHVAKVPLTRIKRMVSSFWLLDRNSASYVAKWSDSVTVHAVVLNPSTLGSITCCTDFGIFFILRLTICVLTISAVLQQPLLQHSSRASYPMASKSLPPACFKAGFCDSHAPVAGTITQSFLDFASKERGINLKQMGVRPGQKWCIETARWYEVLELEKGNVPEVPPVNLACTHAEALKQVDLDVLRKYASVDA
jgi:uncharacterized protein (DUF2237 family)